MADDHDCEALRARYGVCTACQVDIITDPGPVQLPLAGRACSFCQQPVDPHGPRTYRRVVGWTRPRREGGTHALRLRRELDEYACADCVDSMAAGNAPQDSLPIP